MIFRRVHSGITQTAAPAPASMRGYLMCMALACLFGACSQAHAPVSREEPTSAKMDALMTNAGIERTIPLAFFKLYDGVPNDNDLWQSMLGSVWSANVMFKAAHVQFYPAVVKDCHGDGTFANVANDGPVSYDAVDDELTCAFESMPTAIEAPSEPPWTQPKAKTWWLRFAATHYAKESQLVVWIHQNATSNWSTFPWSGRGLHMIAGAPGQANLGDFHQLGHEIGHYFGLYESFDTQIFADDHIRDPSTGEAFGSAGSWDLVYGRPTSGSYQFFTSRASAKAAENAGSALLNIQRYNRTAHSQINCADQVAPLTCTVGEPGYAQDPRTYPDSALKGLARQSATGEARNVMGYLMDPGFQQRFSFSDSQVEIVRKFLRYETSLVWGEADFGCTSTDACIGGRTRLGEYTQRHLADVLDFDGDGKRDIAWWTPPSAFNDSEWVVLRSNTSPPFDPTQKITVTGFGELGDVPVPADYNGDGLTDLAVYRPSNGFSGSDQSYWYACNNTNCASQLPPMPFGTRQDVPLPGLDFDGSANTVELAVFRPSAGFVWRRFYPTVESSSHTGPLPGDGAVPLPGLYDLDNKTDLAVYYPGSAIFALLLSSNGYAQVGLQPVPNDCVGSDAVGASNLTRASCVPIRGMLRHRLVSLWSTVHVPRLALSVWSPNSGMWATNWSPTGAYAEPSYCSLGSSGETPLGGIGSPWSSQPSEIRSRHTTLLAQTWSATGILRFRSSPCGSAWNRGVTSVGPSTLVVGVRDMTGDKLPEIWMVDTNTMAASILASEPDYAAPTAFSPVAVGRNQWSFIL